MFSRSVTINRFLLTVLLVLCTAGLAADDPSMAFTRAADDPDLEWGPCPPFMPEGCGIAVLQGDPAGPNADILFRVPANSPIVSHWHTSAERMILISGNMTVQYEGQDPATLEAGDYAYGPARLRHTAQCNDDGPCVLFIAFEEPVDAFASE